MAVGGKSVAGGLTVMPTTSLDLTLATAAPAIRDGARLTNPDWPAGPVGIVVIVENYAKLETAYSERFAREVLQVVYQRTRALLHDQLELRLVGVNSFLIIFSAFDLSIMPNETKGMSKAAFLEWLLVTLGTEPVSSEGNTVMMALSAYSVGLKETRIDALPIGHLTAVADPVERKWRERYAADMTAVVVMAQAWRSGNVSFVYQPVCEEGSVDRILYYECLARMTLNGQVYGPAHFINALERLDLMRSFDRWTIKRSLAMLRVNPSLHLGCNISASSAVDDSWWASVITQLAENPDVAARLVVEITETSPLRDSDEVVGFVEAMRSVGCRIALDDFGAGNSVVRTLSALTPDIVKIDSGYLRAARNAMGQAAGFRHLIGFAGDFSSTIVVEGVEDAEDLRLAQACGAQWFQGYHVARPQSLPFPGCVDIEEYRGDFREAVTPPECPESNDTSRQRQ